MPDTLFLLPSGFDDPAFPGRRFICKDCATIEGLLASFPDRARGLEVKRVPFPRPRAEVVTLIGAENQNLPVLVFREGGFVNDIEGVLRALHERHGFPERHP